MYRVCLPGWEKPIQIGCTQGVLRVNTLYVSAYMWFNVYTVRVRVCTPSDSNPILSLGTVSQPRLFPVIRHVISRAVHASIF